MAAHATPADALPRPLPARAAGMPASTRAADAVFGAAGVTPVDADGDALTALALAQSARSLRHADRATLLGAPGGDVQLVAFIDYQCRGSRQLCAALDQLLQQDERLQVLLRHLPLSGPLASQTAQLMLCAPAGPTAARLHRCLVAEPPHDLAALQATEARFGLVPGPLALANETLADTRTLAGLLGIARTPAVALGQQLWRGPAALAALEDAVQHCRWPGSRLPALPPGAAASRAAW